MNPTHQPAGLALSKAAFVKSFSQTMNMLMYYLANVPINLCKLDAWKFCQNNQFHSLFGKQTNLFALNVSKVWIYLPIWANFQL